MEMSKPRILVAGDIILDRYLHGSVDRVNPESPGLVFSAERTECRLGGAGAVAYLCAGLGCEVTLIGTVGADQDGAELSLLIKCSGIIDHCQRYGRTTVKQRCVAGGRLLHDRLDWNYDCEISPEQWRAKASSYGLTRFDCIVVADYGRGAAVHAVPELRRRFPETPTIVDPARDAVWGTRYDGASLIKCNFSEASGARQMPADCSLAITDGQNGIYCKSGLIKTEPRQAIDVTGCGDTVTAVLAWKMAQGEELEAACRLANKAAGIQVQRIGVQQIRAEEIESPSKFCDPLEFAQLARNAGKRVVFTNGCFDVLHAGHVATLQRAKALGDVLIVGLNSDESIRRLKGESRPIHSQEHRAAVLAALECVDCVAVFDREPTDLINAIRPDVLAKGGTTKKIVGRETVESQGGVVVKLDAVDGLSSTNAIQHLNEMAAT